MGLGQNMSRSSGGCDCERFRRQIEDLVDRQVDQAEATLLLEHARNCPSCADLQEAEVHLRQLIRQCLRGAPVRVPTRLRARIMVSIHKETMIRLRPIRPEDPSGGLSADSALE